MRNILTEEQKNNIINGYENGLGPTQIAKVIGVSRRTVASFHSKWNLNKDLPPKVKLAKTKINSRIGLFIKKIVSENPRIGYRAIPGKLAAEMPNATWIPKSRAILNFLKKNQMEKKQLLLKPPLNENSRKKRLDFATKWLVDGIDTLGNVIWTDESTFRSHPTNFKTFHWTNKSTKKEELPVQERRQNGGYSVMFWGAISRHGRGPLLVLEGSMDSKKYIEVLKNELIPEINHCKLTYPGSWKLMQDNAPCHRAHAVKAFLNEKSIEFIEWPPYSPDLNPIENVWGYMKQKLNQNYSPPSSEEELIRYVEEIWMGITSELCEKFCINYKNRLQAVINNNGWHTNY